MKSSSISKIMIILILRNAYLSSYHQNDVILSTNNLTGVLDN